jgi:8-oxo-dGTP pyrophosphatase MutT (NUDIX family)
METKAEILHLLQQYAKQYPGEQTAADVITNFVQQHNDDELFNRKNFSGHITASAFILNEKGNRLLLLKHKFLNRWLQPGGHVDYTDASLIAAAQREAEEETGLKAAELQVVTDTIFDIDSHAIPENLNKHEPAHVHHDIRFLFQSLTDEINIANKESTGSKWVPLKELTEDETISRAANKIFSFYRG